MQNFILLAGLVPMVCVALHTFLDDFQMRKLRREILTVFVVS